MIRYLAIGLLAYTTGAFGSERQTHDKNDTYCKDVTGLDDVLSRLPDYSLSSNFDTSATVVGPMKLRPFDLLSAARGQPVCIAIAVSETGVVLDAAVYSPKRVTLPWEERRQLLSTRYTPAMQDGVPTKSIVLMKVW